MLSLLLIISGFNLLLPITGILLLFLDVSVVFHIILLLFSKMSYILEAFLDTSAVSFGIGSGTSIFLGTSSSLNKSIERRKKLLSNQGYVSHAPEQIVNKERENLQLEEKRKAEIEEKMNKLL